MEAKPVKQMYGAVLDTEESFVKVSPRRTYSNLMLNQSLCPPDMCFHGKNDIFGEVVLFWISY